MKNAWTYAGWGGILFLLAVPVELASPTLRGNPYLVFGSILISLVLCVAAGAFHKRWFFIPGILALGLGACLLVSVFSE